MPCVNSGYYFAGLWGLLLAAGCQTDYQLLPAFSAQKQVQVVVLTPAGSNHPQEYDPQTKSFVNAREAGLPKQIRFLPYPGNFGFIPSTAYKGGEMTGEGRPLQTLVLAESVATGTVMEVLPIATLILQVGQELQYTIIAVPARPSEQILAATDFNEFSTRYPVAKEIIQKWFLHHHAQLPTRFLGWKNEKETENLIRRWLL